MYDHRTVHPNSQGSHSPQKPDSEDSESILTLLYEAYSDAHRLNDAQIKADFNELYRLMNGMELREMDQIIYPVCTLCRDHERAGFKEGVKVGIHLAQEIEQITQETIDSLQILW